MTRSELRAGQGRDRGAPGLDRWGRTLARGRSGQDRASGTPLHRL